MRVCVIIYEISSWHTWQTEKQCFFPVFFFHCLPLEDAKSPRFCASHWWSAGADDCHCAGGVRTSTAGGGCQRVQTCAFRYPIGTQKIFEDMLILAHVNVLMIAYACVRFYYLLLTNPAYWYGLSPTNWWATFFSTMYLPHQSTSSQDESRLSMTSNEAFGGGTGTQRSRSTSGSEGRFWLWMLDDGYQMDVKCNHSLSIAVSPKMAIQREGERERHSTSSKLALAELWFQLQQWESPRNESAVN